MGVQQRFIHRAAGNLNEHEQPNSDDPSVHDHDDTVEATVEWDWQARAPVYETAPKSFALDVKIDSDAPMERQQELVAAAKKGCFIEQTLGRGNVIRHRLRGPEGWVDA